MEKKIGPSCQEPWNRVFMICCDHCNEWFHGKCVKQHRDRKNQIWSCPFCSSRPYGVWVRGAAKRKGSQHESEGPPKVSEENPDANQSCSAASERPVNSTSECTTSAKRKKLKLSLQKRPRPEKEDDSRLLKSIDVEEPRSCEDLLSGDGASISGPNSLTLHSAVANDTDRSGSSESSDLLGSPSGVPDNSEDELSSDFEQKPQRKKAKRSTPSVNSKKKDVFGNVTLSSKVSKITCKFCHSMFSSYPSVSRHRKICQLNPMVHQNSKKCATCNRVFARRYIYVAHTKKCASKKIERKKFECTVPECTMTFHFKSALYQHLLKCHKKGVKAPHHFKFSSYDNFLEWKTDVEDRSFSYYSQQSGKRNGKLYFYCQHDGAFKSHRKTGEPARLTSRTNTKGCIKQNKLCTSMMSVTCEEDGTVKTIYYASHSHKCHARDLKFQPQSADTMAFIDQQLAWSVPPRKIVTNLRDDAYKRQNRGKERPLRRENLVKVKNITERRRKKKASLRYATDDASSTEIKVDILSEEEFNPIVIYKAKGQKCKIGPAGAENLPEDVFMLGIQTEAQQDMMKKHAKVILVVDDTHDTNEYDYKLLNLVVRDEFGLGYPVGHLVTSHCDIATLQYFFKALHERSPDTVINCCITDDAPALIGSIETGYGLSIWHILCVWHVHRTIQCKLRECIRDPDIIKEMYEVICVMMDARTEEEFLKCKDSFLREFGNVSSAFTNYFQTTFMRKAKKWAMCYRREPHGGVETTMLVESFHNILKTFYLNRVRNRRIDDLLDLLLQIEEDYYTRWFNAMATESMSAVYHKKIKDRHQRGSIIKDEDVKTISSSFYLVKSQEKGVEEWYTVKRNADVCEESKCIFTCSACHMCTHLYSCTCPDPTPLCKHIHKIHISFNQVSVSAPIAEVAEPVFYAVDLPYDEAPCDEPLQVDRKSHMLQVIRDQLKNVEMELDNSPVKKFMLQRIHNTLSDITSQCKALPKKSTDLPAMEKGQTVYPYQKLKKQMKPFEKKKKQKSNGLQRPNKKSVYEIKQYLFNEEEIEDDPGVPSSGTGNVASCSSSSSNTADSTLQSLHADLHKVLREFKGHKLEVFDLISLTDQGDTLASSLKSVDPKYEPGWVTDVVIKVFFKILEEADSSFFACDMSQSSGVCDSSNLSPQIGKQSTILFPICEDKQLSALLVCAASEKVWYYNPMAEPVSCLSRQEQRLVSSGAVCARRLFPLVPKWSVHRHFDYQLNSRLAVCWFCYQVLQGGSLLPMADAKSCRDSIYNIICSKTCKV